MIAESDPEEIQISTGCIIEDHLPAPHETTVPL